MSQTPAKSRFLPALLTQLSHPLKLRVALCMTLLTLWYGLFFSPMGERVAATTTRVVRERKRVATAKEIERLRKALGPYRDLAGAGDIHELMRYVMRRVRSSPLRLTSLRPETPKDVGPFEAIGLKISLEGGFADMDQFLGWIETEKRPLRIDAIRLAPNTREPGRLSVELTLMTLAEKPGAAAKGKAEARRKP